MRIRGSVAQASPASFESGPKVGGVLSLLSSVGAGSGALIVADGLPVLTSLDRDPAGTMHHLLGDRNLIKKPWIFFRVLCMNPNIMGWRARVS